MHLKALTLKGFKSFASATTMKFEPGICAVVGPNGSGKSNVVDALAWVMGEGSAKTLRGGSMQDVIFAGSGDRKPLGRAEVSLTIDNSDGTLPIDYSEVSVTRRMFRDGASEYEINGSKARLMDIQELLSDTGIGREMHIIVGQGKLSEILESKPEDRRAYIEEAAGVLKHRRRKEKAQRKLDGMQANLDRLQDLSQELNNQLKPLARQADTARRAATVQAQVREAELVLAGDKIVRVRSAAAEKNARSRQLEQQLAESQQRLFSVSEDSSELETELAAVTERAESAQQLWFRLSTLQERLAATVRIAGDRAARAGENLQYSGQDPDELEARAEQADEDYEELVEAAETAAENLEEVREKVAQLREHAQRAESEHLARIQAIADRREGLVRLIAEEESLSSQCQAADVELDRTDEAAAQARERLEHARREAEQWTETLDKLHSEREPIAGQAEQSTAEAEAADQRLKQVRDEQRNREREVYSLSARIETLESQVPRHQIWKHLDDSWNRLADKIKAHPGWEKAVAAALGNYAEALAGQFDTLSWSDMEHAARTVLIDTTKAASSWRIDSELNVEWLLDFVDIDDSVALAVSRILADVVVADSIASAQAIIDQDPRLKVVMRSGEVIGEGWVEIGTTAESSVQLHSQIAQAQQALVTARDQLEELSGTVAGAEQAGYQAREQAVADAATLRDHDTEVDNCRRQGEQARSREASYQSECDTALARVHQARERFDSLQAQHRDVSERLRWARQRDENDEDTADSAQSRPSSSTTETQRDQAEEALRQAQSRETDAIVAARSAQDKAAQLQGKGDALRRQAAHERETKKRHEQAMRRRRQQAELAQAVAGHAETLSRRVEAATKQATAQRDEVIARRQQLNSQVRAARSEVEALRRTVDGLIQDSHRAEVAASQAVVRAEEAEAKVIEQLGIAIDELLRDYTPGENFDQAAATKQLKNAKEDLNALGKVNPLALEEYKAMEERSSYLSQQLDDVISARKDLREMIADVDRQILDLFTSAWRDVEEQFPKVFATLFPGGDGRLILTEPEDMLTTGIEVEARPPGKKVKRLSLLSGGEKSLTALAMLVAIFRARPSPFYVMDEVEAALDDVNLRRLLALFEELRKDSQLIVITHQKPTMDVANVLYGVTMRGDGLTQVISQRLRRL